MLRRMKVWRARSTVIRAYALMSGRAQTPLKQPHPSRLFLVAENPGSPGVAIAARWAAVWSSGL